MFMVEAPMGNLILNRLIGNNHPEFCDELLDSYFFQLTLGSDCFKLFSRQSLSKPLAVIL